MQKKHIYLDIETAPSNDPLLRELLALDITPPGNMSKAETIAAWEEDKKPLLIEEAVKKTSFDGAHGAIAVIGVAFGDSAPESFYTDSRDPHENEAAVLGSFFSELEAVVEREYTIEPVFVGHNIAGFDLRFMFQRAVILGVKPPLFIPFQDKPWGERVFDTMTAWAGYKGTISLDKLARAMGLPGKQGIDGSMVADYIRAGRIAEVADYCANTDVAQVREIHRRMTFMQSDRPSLAIPTTHPVTIVAPDYTADDDMLF